MILTKQEMQDRAELIQKDMREVKEKMDILGTQYQQLTGHFNCMQWAIEECIKKESAEVEPAIEGVVE